MTQSSLFSPPLPAPSCVLSFEEPRPLYRYELTIPVAHGDREIVFVLANPSTAIVVDGRFQSDPTVTRCIEYAKLWGYTICTIGNVRAWRETNPKLVPPDPLAIGPANDAYLRRMIKRADRVVCGWGKLGGARGRQVLQLIRDAGVTPYALALNTKSDGSPQHPLYLSGSLKPFPMGGA
jgi:hypothetical protein